MSTDPRDSFDQTPPTPESAPTEAADSSGARRAIQVGPTQPLTDRDRQRIRTPTDSNPDSPSKTPPPPPLDMQPTIIERPPQFKPPEKSLRPSWIRAGVFVAIPLAVWAAGLATLRKSEVGDLGWIQAVTDDSDGPVVLRPAEGDASSAPLSVSRQGNRIVGLDPLKPNAVLWRFPPGEAATLPGRSLDDAVVWIPRREADRTGDEVRRPALLVFWRDSAAESKEARLSLIDWRGETMWTKADLGEADPGRLFWGEAEGSRVLVFAPEGKEPIRIDFATGRPLPSTP